MSKEKEQIEGLIQCSNCGDDMSNVYDELCKSCKKRIKEIFKTKRP